MPRGAWFRWPARRTRAHGTCGSAVRSTAVNRRKTARNTTPTKARTSWPVDSLGLWILARAKGRGQREEGRGKVKGQRSKVKSQRWKVKGERATGRRRYRFRRDAGCAGVSAVVRSACGAAGAAERGDTCPHGCARVGGS